MRFLNSDDARQEIKRLMVTSPSADLAVAFWGAGALEELGIDERNHPLRLICNLSSGGSNPDVIRSLRTAHCRPTVRQNDRLHAKVYLFENAAVIGSSNASANGLALEGAELTHWHEANVLVTDKATLDSIRSWMKNLETQEVTEEDLARAEARWTRRRNDAPIPGNTVLEELLKNPEQFKDREAYFLLYFDDLSDDGYEFWEALTKEFHTDKIGIFEDWSELRDGMLLCFQATPRSFIFDGIWRRDSAQHPDRQLGNGNSVQIVTEEDNLFTLVVEPQEMKIWRRICRELARQRGRNDAIDMTLFELGEWLSQETLGFVRQLFEAQP